MPTLIDIRPKGKKKKGDAFLLLKEGEEFPLNAVMEIKKEITEYVQEHPDYTSEELLIIAEDIVEKYKGTIIPFRAFILNV